MPILRMSCQFCELRITIYRFAICLPASLCEASRAGRLASYFPDQYIRKMAFLLQRNHLIPGKVEQCQKGDDYFSARFCAGERDETFFLKFAEPCEHLVNPLLERHDMFADNGALGYDCLKRFQNFSESRFARR